VGDYLTDNSNIAFICEALTFCDKLTEQDKTLILNNVSVQNYKRGENIHSYDNDCVGVLLIKSGELRAYILSEDGREITLYRLVKGEVCILSASCVLKNITFDVHIDAEKDSEVLILNSSVFEQVSSRNIYAENFSNKITVQRFSEVMNAMQQILFSSFDKRLAVFLIDEIAQSGTDTISMTHEQIANYVGSAREVVSRMLKYFENIGIVKLSRGKVTIVDKKRLRDFT